MIHFEQHNETINDKSLLSRNIYDVSSSETNASNETEKHLKLIKEFRNYREKLL